MVAPVGAQGSQAGILQRARRVAAPDLAIGRVRHDQLATFGKHRNRLVHLVNHRLAQLQIGAVAPGAQHLARDILDHQRNRAIGMRPADHPVGLAARQAPGFLIQPRGRRLFQFDQLPPPAPVILGFRDHVAVAHRIQHRQKRGPQRQKVNRQPGQVQQGRVEQLQLALTVKDRQPDMQMGKGLGQGLHEIAQRRLGLHRHIGGQGKDQPPAALTRAALTRAADTRVTLAGRDQIIPRRPPAAQLQLLALAGHALGAGCPFKQPRQRKGQFLPLIAQIANPQHIGGIGPDHIAIALLAPDQHRGLGHRHAQKVQLL